MKNHILSTFSRSLFSKHLTSPCIFLHKQIFPRQFSDKGHDPDKPNQIEKKTSSEVQTIKEETNIEEEYKKINENSSQKKYSYSDDLPEDYDNLFNKEKPGLARALRGLKSETNKTWGKLQDPFSQYQGNSLFPTHVDVLIIGGGAIGSSIAYFLKQRVLTGCRVAVLDRNFTVDYDLKEYATASTTLSSGLLQQQFSLCENIEMSKFGAEFLRNIKHHCHIHDEQEACVNFTPNGYLFCADDKEAEALEKNYQMQKELGIKNVLLTPSQLETRFPWLNTEGISSACLGLEKEGWFDPYLYLTAIRKKAINLGAEYVRGDAINFVRRTDSGMLLEYYEEGEYQAVNECVVRDGKGELRSISFAYCIIAAGANTSQVAQLLKIGDKSQDQGMLFVPIPVEPRKRFLYCFEAPKGPGVNTPVVVDPSNVYFRREGLGNYYICGKAPTPEQEPSVDDLEIDYEFFNDNIRPHLTHRVKSFDELKLSNAWASYCDYNYFDENCIIGLHPGYHNIHFATGFSGHGIQFAPAIGRAMTELLIDGEFKTIDLSRFQIQRVIQRAEAKEDYLVN